MRNEKLSLEDITGEGRNIRPTFKNLGIDKDRLSGGLSNHRKEAVTVSNGYFRLNAIGTLATVYNLTLKGRLEGSNERFRTSSIAKIIRPNEYVRDFSGTIDQRKDSLVYETIITQHMPDYVPKHIYHDKNLLIEEDLGENSLERIFLIKNMGEILQCVNESAKTKEVTILLENLVSRIAGFHVYLAEVSHRFRNVLKRLEPPDYASRFELYASEIWRGLYEDRPLDDESKKELRDFFMPIARILERGYIKNDNALPRPIHQDLHPPHIFYKCKEGINAFFIDMKPRLGPVQFDLVDCLAHPIVQPQYGHDEDKIIEFIELYHKERARISTEKLGMHGLNGFSPDEDAITDSKGMYYISKGYRGFRGASKRFSIEKNNPAVYKHYVKKNHLYPHLKDYYIPDAIESFEHLLLNGSSYGLNRDELFSLQKLRLLLKRLFPNKLVNKKEDFISRLN